MTDKPKSGAPREEATSASSTETPYSFPRNQHERLTGEHHHNPLPRSVIRHTPSLLLDGEWRFALDLEDRGLREQWHLGHAYTSTANWPGSIERQMAAGRDVLQRAPSEPDVIVGWYERDFTIPSSYLPPHCHDCLPQLTFGACGYETRVWLNGQPLHTIEGEEVHYGEYTSFSYELDPALLQPVNRLTVRIADSLDTEIPRGKQESRVYKRGGIWYQAISGPVRSVWLELVQRNRLRTRLDVISTIEDGLVEFNVTTRVHEPGDYTLRLALTPHGADQPVASGIFPLPLAAGERQQRVVLQVPDARLWSPDEPQDYHLTAHLVAPTGEISQIEARCGLRKIEARGCSVYLNNRRLYLDGILYQPGTATFEEMRRHLLAIKRLGCNLVRVHIAGIDPRIYDLADEIGLLVWAEVPSPHSSSQRSRANHWDELMRMLVFIGSHPSVVIWSLYNEDWGAEDIAGNAETRAYISRVYAYMRLHHPQLLVVDNDGWHHVSTEGRLESHLLTAHIYTPDLDRWRELLARLVAGDNEGVAVNPLVVGDPFFYQGQVPLVVSEWGGFGFVTYGGPEEMAAKAERIHAFKAALRQCPIAGDVYTQAVEIEDETNGVIDPASGELLLPEGIFKSAAPGP